MKPVKMTMMAFGPYKTKETINFGELGDHRLFVVSGNTGAGKTSIFDAICFALYGEASGKERKDPQLLRSHFADDGIHTSVALTFDIHGRRYEVFRQLPHVKVGNKTATGAQYELHIIEGEKKVPAVDRFNVTDINEKIESILGLTKDQFSQIVMLPQGEFRKLLTSETENKEEILRRIFKTGIYRLFSERLKEEKQSAAEQYNGLIHERNLYISQIQGVIPERENAMIGQVLSQEHYNPSQLLDALQVEATHYRGETARNQDRLAKAIKAHKEKTAEYHKGEAVNEKFRVLDDKQSRKIEMDQEIPKMRENKERLEKAEKASRLRVYEQNRLEAMNEKTDKKQDLEKAVQYEKETSSALEKAKAVYDKEKKAEPQREQVKREIDRFRGFLPVVSELAEKQKQLDEMKATEQKEIRELAAIEQKLEKAKGERKLLSEEIRKLDSGLKEYPKKLKRLSDLREQSVIVRSFIKLRTALANADQAAAEKNQSYQKALESYQQLEKRWYDGQAGLLAHHLHDGKPCPVCGSTEHPDKASAGGQVPSKDELERSRKDKDDKQTAYMNAKSERDSLANQLKDKGTDLESVQVSKENLEEKYERMLTEGKGLREETEQLEKNQEKLNRLKKASEETERQIDSESQKLESARKVRQAHHLELEKLQALHQQASEQIPEALRTVDQLKTGLNEKEELKTRLEERWESAQKALQDADKAATEAEANAKSAKKQVDEAEAKSEIAEKRFAEQLEASGFLNNEAYKEAKMAESDQQALKKTIDEFERERVYIEKQMKELELELKSASRQDLQELRIEVEQLEKATEQAREAVRESERLENEAVRIREKIESASQKAKAAEEALQMATDLYNTARGDNPKKISFERYMQIEFLEQIVHAANLRLRRLSNGQFYLVRSQRLERRGRQSGLGLDVYDAYTGQTRDVKTLSGGEKFNASLCLALGMADVIQAFEGGISIETMFIDEGFGSLDEESLNKAIDTLADLQKFGRVVGVISHVQELKSAIPAVLEVKKTKEGHSQTKFVLT